MSRDELIERMARAIFRAAWGENAWENEATTEFERDEACEQAMDVLASIDLANLVIVPRDSTDAMHHAGRAAFETAHDEEANSWEGCEAVWSAMIKASPFVEKKQ